VCEGVHMSPSHLSNIFKKELGMTFVQYVTDYRMNKAKQLLKYTALKTYEIAEAVGYADSQYFSTAFKKQVKMSPLAYRSVHGESGHR
ncbi:MAG: helix-turn-helix transcriptional regulator, partial [Cellulosilyticaceae bacterium]